MRSEATGKRQSEVLENLTKLHLDLLTGKGRNSKWIKFDVMELDGMDDKQKEEYAETISDCWSIQLNSHYLEDNTGYGGKLKDVVGVAIASNICYPLIIVGQYLVDRFRAEDVAEGIGVVRDSLRLASGDVALGLEDLLREMELR